MKSKKSAIFILLLFTALVLAGVFYWSFIKTQDKLNNLPNESAQNYSNLPNTEKEISTSTPPFVIKDEMSRGNPAKKQIIFTFDAGAGSNSLQKILEVTKAHNLKLTFFSTGKFAQKYPDLIKQIAAEDHEIFNHTYSHPHLTEKTDEQVKNRIYSNLKNGSIILMHIGDNITGNILEEVFTKIKNDGYKIVSLTEGLK